MRTLKQRYDRRARRQIAATWRAARAQRKPRPAPFVEWFWCIVIGVLLAYALTH